MSNPTTPPYELRSAVAEAINAVDSKRVGQVHAYQFYADNWSDFSSRFTWEDPDDWGKKWVRGWIVAPDTPQGRLIERSVGMGNVRITVRHSLLVRGVQTLGEEDAQYEPFGDLCWNVFMALVKQRDYTLTEGSVVVLPTVSWESYSNRTIGGVVCHTTEIRIDFDIEMSIDLT